MTTEQLKKKIGEMLPLNIPARYYGLKRHENNNKHKKQPTIGLYPKGQFYLPTEKQKPQIDFLRFLCYNKNNNLKEDKEDAYERCD